ncbi:unnamed protein product, partial [Ceratitis capitata]
MERKKNRQVFTSRGKHTTKSVLTIRKSGTHPQPHQSFIRQRIQSSWSVGGGSGSGGAGGNQIKHGWLSLTYLHTKAPS